MSLILFFSPLNFSFMLLIMLIFMENSVLVSSSPVAFWVTTVVPSHPLSWPSLSVWLSLFLRHFRSSHPYEVRWGAPTVLWVSSTLCLTSACLPAFTSLSCLLWPGPRFPFPSVLTVPVPSLTFQMQPTHHIPAGPFPGGSQGPSSELCDALCVLLS